MGVVHLSIKLQQNTHLKAPSISPAPEVCNCNPNTCINIQWKTVCLIFPIWILLHLHPPSPFLSLPSLYIMGVGWDPRLIMMMVMAPDRSRLVIFELDFVGTVMLMDTTIAATNFPKNFMILCSVNVMCWCRPEI